MTDKNIQLRIDTAINAAETANSISEVRKALRDLNTLALETSGSNAEAFQQVALAAGELKDRVGDARAAIASVSGEPIENLAGSFKQLTSGIASLDFDKASAGARLFTASIKDFKLDDLKTKFENLKKELSLAGDAITEKLGTKAGATVAGLSNVVAGLGKTAVSAIGGDFKGAINGLGQSFTGLGQIIKANPLLLLAGVVIELIVNFKKLEGLGGALGNVFKIISGVIGAVVDSLKALTDAIGLTGFAQKKLHDDMMKQLKDENDQQEKRLDYQLRYLRAIGASEEVIAAQERRIKLQAIDAAKSAYKEADSQVARFPAIAGAKAGQEIPKEDLLRYNKEAVEARTKAFQDIFNAQEELRIYDAEKNKAYRDKLLQQDKDAADKAKAAADKAQTENKQRQAERDRINAQNKTQAEKDAADGLKILEKQGHNILTLDDQQSKDRLLKFADNIKAQADYIEKNKDKLYPGMTPEKRAEFAKAEQDALWANYMKEAGDLDKFNETRVQKEKETADKVLEVKKLAVAKAREQELSTLRNNADGTAATAESNPTLANTLAAIEAEYAYQKAARVLAMQDELADVENNEALKQSIKDKYRTLELSADKKLEQNKLKARLDVANKSIGIAQNFSNVLGSLNDLVTQGENQRLKAGEKLTVEIQKRQFNRQKALGLVSAVINTAQGITAALTQPPPYSFIAAALTGVAGAIQIATIASKRFDPDSSGSSGSDAPAAIGGLPGLADSSANVSVPSLVGLDGKPDIGQNRVYVVESDITDAQGRVARARDASRLGN